MSDQDHLISCESEPIHRPGNIQPFGALLILNPKNQRLIAHAGAEPFFGCAALEPGQSLDDLLEGTDGAPASELLAREGKIALQHVRLRSRTAMAPLDVAVHRGGEHLLLEIELEKSLMPEEWAALQRELQHGIQRLHETETVAQLCDATTSLIQRLTQLDRCMVYRFDTDWHGEVISETLNAQGTACSYLGHHFPASDIPPQARRIFETNWLRIIADVDAVQIPLSAVVDPRTQEYFDLSTTLLRSPSPLHLEYLRNMDVGASLTISLLQNNKLWGLVTCHHGVAYHLPLPVRLACEYVGRFVSANLAVKTQQEEKGFRSKVTQAVTEISRRVQSGGPIEVSLCKSTPTLVSIAPSAQTAAAVRLRGRWTFLGQVPSLEQLSALLRWLDLVVGSDGVYATRCLQTDYPPAKEFTDVASGLLAVALPNHPDNYLLWFRPEMLQLRTWAGSPHKIVPTRSSQEEDVGCCHDGGLRIHPRKSFAAWQELVSGTSAPWLPAELDAAIAIKRSIVEAKLVQQLEREVEMRTDLETQRSRFKFLSEASDVLMTSLDLNVCLEHFARRLTQQFCDSCVIYLRGPDKAWVRAVMHHHTAQGQSVLKALLSFEGLDTVVDSPLAQAFLGEPVYRARVNSDWLQRVAPSAAYEEFLTQTLGAESLLAVPMCTRDTCVGVIKFLRSERVDQFTRDDLVLAMELARRAANAVENVSLYRDANQAIVTRENVLHVVSHDLKSPIAAITLSADVIERKLSKANGSEKVDVHKPLSRIRTSGQRMLRLIDDLLNVAKMENGQFTLEKQEVTTDALLQDIHSLAEPLANAKGVEVHLKNPYADAVFPCDKDRMLRVIGNLVGNAIKFTPPGGTVTLEVSEADGHHVTFAVRDTGPGIKSEDLPHVFDRYWQASRTASQGTGLGLFIAQGIVHAHSGTISVESEPARGATFWLRLPQRPSPDSIA